MKANISKKQRDLQKCIKKMRGGGIPLISTYI